MQEIRFGTDGWRGRIADDYTFTNVRRCAQGFAGYLLEKGQRDEWVVVGFDRRFQSENFAVTVAEVLAANGLRVFITEGATPTPVISYSVVNKGVKGYRIGEPTRYIDYTRRLRRNRRPNYPAGWLWLQR